MSTQSPLTTEATATTRISPADAMPLYLFPLLLSILIMGIERLLCPGAWLVGLWMILLLVGALMMAFQGLRINRDALRSPTAPLLVLDGEDEAGDATQAPPKRRLKLVK